MRQDFIEHCSRHSADSGGQDGQGPVLVRVNSGRYGKYGVRQQTHKTIPDKFCEGNKIKWPGAGTICRSASGKLWRKRHLSKALQDNGVPAI